MTKQNENLNEQDGNFDQPNVNESLALAGLFRRVSVKERLPEKSGTYYSAQGQSVLDYTRPVNVTAWKEGRDGLEWWLEEFELPSDEQIEKVFSTDNFNSGENDNSEELNNCNELRQEGAKWMRSLAVTAKDNVR